MLDPAPRPLSAGSPLRVPGLVLLDDENVLWTHPFRHGGDRPSAEAVLRAVDGTTASAEVGA